jgi:hypothetical protein
MGLRSLGKTVVPFFFIILLSMKCRWVAAAWERSALYLPRVEAFVQHGVN